jgi:hypothetical protein
MQAIGGDDEFRLAGYVVLPLLSTDADDPLALHYWLAHPETRAYLYPDLVGLLHQEMIQHQPGQSETIEGLPFLEKTPPAGASVVIGDAHALQPLRRRVQHSFQDPEMRQQGATCRAQIFRTRLIAWEGRPLQQDDPIALPR